MRSAQTTGTVLMVRPTAFHGNPQTAATNLLQQPAALPHDELLATAQREFDGAVAALSRAGIDVLVLEPPSGPPKGPSLPDALFPNNWFSTHADGTLVLYPMLAENRRLERRPDLARLLTERFGLQVARTIDLSDLERAGQFVEGTGSLVLDRTEGIAYAGLSPRSTAPAIHAACEALGMEACSFVATHASGAPIYHTNVMMSVGSQVAIVCLETIRDADQRAIVIDRLQATGKALVVIDEAQMHAFCGNVLELASPAGPLLAVSVRAWRAFDAEQRRTLEQHLSIWPIAVDTIEQVGGGGIRCMLAEIHLPTK